MSLIVVPTSLLPLVSLGRVLRISGSQVNFTPIDGSSHDLVNEPLGYCFLLEGNETKALALTRIGISNDLSRLHLTKVCLKMLSEVLLCESIVKSTNEDLSSRRCSTILWILSLT